MRFSIVDGIRTSPRPHASGTCPFCGAETIAKCGQYVRWHWAHKRFSSCDPWHESETNWHLKWKDCFPPEYQEIVHIDEVTGERHIADVKASGGTVVEVQHSPISDKELISREQFYGDMIWIVDARDLSGYFTLGTSNDLAICDPLCYHFQWFSRSSLMQRWSMATKPVYFDTRIDSDLIPHVDIPSSKYNLWRVLNFNVDTKLGFIAPVPSDILVNSVLNGSSPPLMRCEEKDAGQYRREMVQIYP